MKDEAELIIVELNNRNILKSKNGNSKFSRKNIGLFKMYWKCIPTVDS